MDVKFMFFVFFENVVVVCYVLGAFVGSMRLFDEFIEDFCFVVMEVCTNVVCYAYVDGDLGAVEIIVELGEQ